MPWMSLGRLATRVTKGKRSSGGARPGFDVFVPIGFSRWPRFFEELLAVYGRFGHCRLFPGILPELSLRQPGIWKTFDRVEKPMAEPRVVQAVHAVLDRARAAASPVTFKSLRCILPTPLF